MSAPQNTLDVPANWHVSEPVDALHSRAWDVGAAQDRTKTFLRSSLFFRGEPEATGVWPQTETEHRTTRGSNSGSVTEEISNVIKFSLPHTPPERPHVAVVAVQEWEGVVDKVAKDHLLATLTDVSADAHRPTDQILIPLGVLDEEDRREIAKGVIFRLAVGRERRGGSVKNTTLLYIRKRKYRPEASPSEVTRSFTELFDGWK